MRDRVRGHGRRDLKIFLILALVLIACACEGAAQGDPKDQAAKGGASADPGDGSPVVIIDGEPITRAQFENELFDRFAENHLEAFIDARLVEKKAAQMGVVADEARIKAEVEKNVDTLLKTRFGGNEASMRQALTERGMSLEGWRKELASKARQDQLIDAMLKKTRGQDSEGVKRQFEQKYGEEGVKFRVRHILISTKVINTRFYSKEEFEAEKVKIDGELKATAATIQQRIQGGESFETLAKEFSDDYTASRGGDLGEAWKGRFGNTFDDAAAALTVGKVSGLVQAKRGFHIIEVTKINEGVEYQGSAILVSTGPDGPADQRTQEARDKAAEEKVAKIKADLASGKAFADVAREVSDDMATRTRGGDLGIFGRRRLGSEVDEVLEGAAAGTITEPIKTPRGMWIIKLDSRKAVPDKDRREVRHIFLSNEYDDVKKRRLEDKLEEMARKKAEEIKGRIEGGAEFKDLAAEETEDAYTRKAGGEYYNYRKSSLGPEVWDAIQNLEPLKATALVQSNRGFHIVQVMEKTVTKFDDVKAELLAELNEQPVTPAEARTWLEDARKAALIDRKIGVAPADPPSKDAADPKVILPAGEAPSVDLGDRPDVGQENGEQPKQP